MMRLTKIAETLTGETRMRTRARLFRRPRVIVECEVKTTYTDGSPLGEETRTEWREVREDDIPCLEQRKRSMLRNVGECVSFYETVVDLCGKAHERKRPEKADFMFAGCELIVYPPGRGPRQ